jgi:outer membrane protein insertion porin family
MINLLALTLSVTLMAGAVVNASFESAQDAQQRKRDEDSERKKAAELLLRASRIEIEFVGNRFFPSPILLEQMKLARDPEQPDRPALIPSWSLRRLEDDLERVRYFLGTQGFITAKSGEPKIEDLGDLVKVTVQIEEGLRYRIGNIGVKGVKLLTPEQIIEISGLRTGEIINANIISENLYKGITDIYSDQGYIQAHVGFIPNFRPTYPGASVGIVDITLDIDEGRAFFISSVKFDGLVKTDEQSLRDLLLLRGGDLFSRRMFIETLKRLNRLGLFEEVQEKDVIFRTSDKDSTVWLTIHVNELKRQ